MSQFLIQQLNIGGLEDAGNLEVQQYESGRLLTNGQ